MTFLKMAVRIVHEFSHSVFKVHLKKDFHVMEKEAAEVLFLSTSCNFRDMNGHLTA